MPIVDLGFPLQGDEIPADHGYALSSAICRVIPSLHENPGVGIHPVRGMLVGKRRLRLDRRSYCNLRIPSEQTGEFLLLAGKRLDLDGFQVRVGVPKVSLLKPAPYLYSHLVTIKGYTEPEPFLAAVRRQLSALGVQGEAALRLRQAEQPVEGGTSNLDRCPFVRRTLSIREKTIVGFALGVGELTAEESVRLQEAGVGGRRRFGCGVFVPLPENSSR